MTSNHRNRRFGLCHWRSTLATRRQRKTTPSSLPFQKVPTSGNQLRGPREGTPGNRRHLQTLEVLLRRSHPPSTGILRSSKPGILYNNKGPQQMADTVGTGGGRHRLPDLLLTRDSERKTRRTIKTFGVPPGKGGDRKPADYNGFGKKPLCRTKLARTDIYLLLSTTRFSPNEKMGGRIYGKNKGKRTERYGLSTSMEGNGSCSPKGAVDGPKGQERVGNPGRAALQKKAYSGCQKSWYRKF